MSSSEGFQLREVGPALEHSAYPLLPGFAQAVTIVCEDRQASENGRTTAAKLAPAVPSMSP